MAKQDEAVSILAVRDQEWAELRSSADTLEELMRLIGPGLFAAVHDGHEVITLQVSPMQLAVMMQAMSICHGELLLRREGLVV